jgi:hypothetical protein
LQNFINVSGNYSQQTNQQSSQQPSQQPDSSSSLPTWVIILISVTCAVIFILIIIGIWFYFRYKKIVKPNDKNDQTMQEVWSAFDTKTRGNNQVDLTLTFGNTESSTSQSNSIYINNALMSYDYLKHEVDLQDMENTKAIAKI